MALLLQRHSRLNLGWEEEHRTGVRIEIRENIGTAVAKVRGPFKKVISYHSRQHFFLMAGFPYSVLGYCVP